MCSLASFAFKSRTQSYKNREQSAHHTTIGWAKWVFFFSSLCVRCSFFFFICNVRSSTESRWCSFYLFLLPSRSFSVDICVYYICSYMAISSRYVVREPELWLLVGRPAGQQKCNLSMPMHFYYVRCVFDLLMEFKKCVDFFDFSLEFPSILLLAKAYCCRAIVTIKL